MAVTALLFDIRTELTQRGLHWKLLDLAKVQALYEAECDRRGYVFVDATDIETAAVARAGYPDMIRTHDVGAYFEAWMAVHEAVTEEAIMECRTCDGPQPGSAISHAAAFEVRTDRGLVIWSPAHTVYGAEMAASRVAAENLPCEVTLYAPVGCPVERWRVLATGKAINRAQFSVALQDWVTS